MGQIIYIYSHVTLSKVLFFYTSSMSTRIIYFLIYLSHFFHYAQPSHQATAASTQSARWTTLDDFSTLENSVKIQSHTYSQARWNIWTGSWDSPQPIFGYKWSVYFSLKLKRLMIFRCKVLVSLFSFKIRLCPTNFEEVPPVLNSMF